ncbi:thioesterase family protein [Nesterenkonia sp.]|uniref:acyl-CoA thioesterase n=1 Tax=Nesterenkonia sp. TaxID=704201 RepID=UPI00260B9F05|nr:thioesterase family protein [Nesterenkonia sp.]
MTAIAVSLQLRWGDQDPYGHVNNVAILRLLEEARARAFWRSGSDPDQQGIFPPLAPDQELWALVADFQLKYRGQLPYQRDPVTVEMTVPSVGGASFVIDYALRSDPELPAPQVTARSTLVMVDRETGSPRRLSPEVRSQLLQFAP